MRWLGGWLSVAMLLVSGCDARRDTSPPIVQATVGADRPVLKTVPLPNISSASESVQSQLRAQHASLMRITDRRGASSAERADAYGEMGKLFVASEFLDAARDCFSNARTLSPTDMRWPYLLGHVARLLNDSQTASTYFEQTLALQPDHVPSLIWLAEIHLAQNRPDEAAPLLVKAQSVTGHEAPISYALGRVSLAKRDYAQAVKQLDEALQLAPSATRIHYPLALAYRALGERAKAEDHLRRRGDVEPQYADPLLAQIGALLQNATAYEARGADALNKREWAEAVTNLRKASELAPGNAFTRLNLGTALYQTGDAKGALDEFEAAVRLSPGLVKAHYSIGVLMAASHRDADAVKAFTAALRGEPANVDVRLALADALRSGGRDEESLAHYAQVIAIDPGLSQASFGYAMALVRLGRYRDARDRLLDATRTFSDQPGFAHALARLLAAAPDDGVRDGRRAVSLAGDLLKTQQSLGLAETMAMALAEVGRYDEAVTWQGRAIAAARSGGRADLAARLAENLRLYERRQPCRTPWRGDDPVFHPGPN